MLPNWKAHNQIEALVLDKRGKKLTIKERAQYCAKTKDVVSRSWVGSEQIDIYIKLPEVTRDSNEIQKRQLEQQLPNPPKTPKHFSLKEGLRRIQNINTTKIPTMQDLANVIMMLSMRPAEVTTLRIIHYEPGESNPSEWYKPGYSWYCIG
ncbi:12014_t:CDS:2, partial [Gigaspora rosea]